MGLRRKFPVVTTADTVNVATRVACGEYVGIVDANCPLFSNQPLKDAWVETGKATSSLRDASKARIEANDTVSTARTTKDTRITEWDTNYAVFIALVA